MFINKKYYILLYFKVKHVRPHLVRVQVIINAAAMIEFSSKFLLFLQYRPLPAGCLLQYSGTIKTHSSCGLTKIQLRKRCLCEKENPL